MHAELYRPEEPETVVAVATWSGRRATIEPSGAAIEGLERLLRPTPVVIEDASLRRQGTHGESMLQPGSLDWFRAALTTRAPSIGLAVRFVAAEITNGWDPAANYRTFAEQADRIASS